MKYETEHANPGFPLNQIQCFGMRLSTEDKTRKNTKADYNV